MADPWIEYLADLEARLAASAPPPKDRFTPLQSVGQAIGSFTSNLPNVGMGLGALGARAGVEGVNNPLSSLADAVGDIYSGGLDVADQVSPLRLLPGDYLAGQRAQREQSREFVQPFIGALGSLDQRAPDLPATVSTGFEDFARRQFIEAEMRRRQYEFDNPAPQGWGDQLVNAGTRSLLEGGTALGVGALAGLATRNPGAASAATTATMGAFNFDRNVSAQQQARGVYTDIDAQGAAVGALAQTGVDRVLGRFFDGADATRAMLGQPLGQSLTRGFAAGAARGALSEGTAEVIQTAIERQQAGLPLASRAALGEYGQGFVMGAALGGGMGGVTGALAALSDTRAAQAESSAAGERLEALRREAEVDRAYASLRPDTLLALGAPETRLALGAPETPLAVEGPAPRLGIEGPPSRPMLEPPVTAGVPALPSPDGTPPMGARDVVEVNPAGVALPRSDIFPGQDPVVQRFEDPARLPVRQQLVQTAATTGTITSDPVSPFVARTFLFGGGRPYAAARVLGPGTEAGTVSVYNERTGKTSQVPIDRVGPVLELRDGFDPKTLPLSVRKVEEMRAKDLHRQQISAIASPSPAGVLPIAPAVEAPLPVSTPPMGGDTVSPPAEAPVVTQAAGVPFTGGPVDAPVDTPQDPLFGGSQVPLEGPVREVTPPAPADVPNIARVLNTRDGGSTVTFDSGPPAKIKRDPATGAWTLDTAGMRNPPPGTLGHVDPVLGTSKAEALRALPQKVAQLRGQPLPGLRPVREPLNPRVKRPPPKPRPPAPPVLDKAGLTPREQEYNKAGPYGVLDLLRVDMPEYEPIIDAVQDRLLRLRDIGYEVTFEMMNAGDLQKGRIRQGVYGTSEYRPEVGVLGRANTVVLAGSARGVTDGPDSVRQTILHELVHAVTQPLIYGSVAKDSGAASFLVKTKDRNAAALEMESLRKELLRRKSELPPIIRSEAGLSESVPYRLSNVHELIAYGMSNPEFQNAIERLETEGPSLFTRFVEAVRKAIGIPQSAQTLLTRLIKLSGDLLATDVETDAKYIRALRERGFDYSAAVEMTPATGPAVTNPNGPELSAAFPPMSLTDEDAVFAIQQVEAAALDPKFTQELKAALKEELRAYGFNGRVPLELNFTDAAGPSAWFSTAGGRNSITIALGLANNTKDVPSALQALRPFLTHEVVEFGQRYGLITPAERKTLLDFAASETEPNGQTLLESVRQRYATQTVNLSPQEAEQVIENEAVAYAAEYLTRLNAKAAPRRAGQQPLRRPKTTEKKAATDFKGKLKALGASVWRALTVTTNKDAAREVATRLAKGDIAARARGDGRFTQRVIFNGWNATTTSQQAVVSALRTHLDDMGLPDVSLRFASAVLKPNGKGFDKAGSDVLGSYFARTITISSAAYDPSLTVEQNIKNLTNIVDHEAVHALRVLGTWTPNQWQNLVAFTRIARDPDTGETYQEKAARQYGAFTQGMPSAEAADVISEEAVALAFADNYDVKVPRATAPQRSLDRIAQTLIAQNFAMKQAGIASPEMLISNGNDMFAAVRAGASTLTRRRNGALSPREMSVKFALANSKMEGVNPATDPDEDVKDPGFFKKMFDPATRARNPFANYTESDQMLDWVTGIRQREQSITSRLPFLGRFIDPTATIPDRDRWLLLRKTTLGDINDFHRYISLLKTRLEPKLNRNAKMDAAARAYMQTRDADPYAETVGGQPNPAYIPDDEVREGFIEIKNLTRQIGKILLDSGRISQETYDAMDGQYLHRRYLDNTKAMFSSTRLILGDLGFLKQRTNPPEIERAAKGEELDTLTSATTYLAKASHAVLLDRMYKVMLDYSSQQDPDMRNWLIGAEDTILWNGRRNSPMAVEAEIDSFLDRISDAAAELALAKTDKQKARAKEIMERANDNAASAAKVLLRNKLWLGRKGTSAAEIMQEIGGKLTPAGTIPNDAMDAVADDQIIALYKRVREGGIRFSDVQRNVVWRERTWSVLELERELDRLEEDVTLATQPWDEPDPLRDERMRMVKEQIHSGKIQLMRNTLWQNLHGMTPDMVVQSLGDFSPEAVDAAYTNARHQRAVNAIDTTAGGLAGRAARLTQQLVDALPGVASLASDIVMVPDTPRWGAMRGMLMAREVYDVMNNTGAVIENFVQNSAESGDNMSASARIAQFFQNGTTVMKKTSTVWNPGSHNTNWIGNFVQGSTYGGVDPVNWAGHVAMAVKEVLNQEGPAYEAFRRFGGSQAGNTAGDISVVTDPLRVASQREIENLRDRVNAGATPQELFRAFMAVSQDRIERVDNRLTDIYQLSDSVMKVALMRAHMKRGLSAEESFLNAEEVFFDYGLVPPVVRAARNMPFGSPFISWTYMATALTIKKSTEMTVLRRNEDGSELRVPNALFLLPWLVAYSVIQGLALAGDEMDDEDLKFLRPGLPPFLKEGFGTLYAGLDESGRAQLIDAAKYLPFGTMVRLAQMPDDTATGTVGGAVGPGAVLKELGFFGDLASKAMMAVLQMTPTGRSTSKAGETPIESAGAVAGAVSDIFLPPWARGLHNGTNPIVGDAGLATSGLANRDTPVLPYQENRPMLTFWQKALKLGGVGVYVVDPVPSLEDNVKRHEQVWTSMRSELRKIATDPTKTEEEKDAAQARLEARAERVLGKLEESKALLAEATRGPFYQQYRRNVREMGLPDPEVSRRLQEQRDSVRFKDKDYRAMVGASE